MGNKKFILNADDFGMSKAYNMAVIEGYHNGFLRSASICANGDAFDAAVNEVIPECPELGIGVHLNIIEGKSLSDNSVFNNSYLKLIYLSNNKNFMEKIEKEFRLQIEKVMNFVQVTHLDSHVHTHAIPNIFELTCKLAKEYGIKQVRTQSERFYITPSIWLHLNLKYPPNLLKIVLLNYFTSKNKPKAVQYGLSTNDYLIGVGYTGLMNDKTVYYGLQKFEDDNNITVEALIHPKKYDSNKKNNQHFKEFLITKDMDLKDKIQRLGFVISNYKE